MYYQTMQSQAREKQQQLRQEARLYGSARRAGNAQNEIPQSITTGKMAAAAIVVATAAATLLYII